MATLPQVEPLVLAKRFQVLVTEDAYRRIKVEAAKKSSSPGQVISQLAIEHLAPVEEVEAA